MPRGDNGRVWITAFILAGQLRGTTVLIDARRSAEAATQDAKCIALVSDQLWPDTKTEMETELERWREA